MIITELLNMTCPDQEALSNETPTFGRKDDNALLR